MITSDQERTAMLALPSLGPIQFQRWKERAGFGNWQLLWIIFKLARSKMVEKDAGQKVDLEHGAWFRTTERGSMYRQILVRTMGVYKHEAWLQHIDHIDAQYNIKNGLHVEKDDDGWLAW